MFKLQIYIYITCITGLFICPKCKYSSQWNILEQYLTLKHKTNLENIRNDINSNKIKSEQQCMHIVEETELVTEDLIKTHEDFYTKFGLDVSIIYIN